MYLFRAVIGNRRADALRCPQWDDQRPNGAHRGRAGKALIRAQARQQLPQHDRVRVPICRHPCCTMRVELSGHFKTCMTDICLRIWCAHGRLYPHAPAATSAVVAPAPRGEAKAPVPMQSRSSGAIHSGVPSAPIPSETLPLLPLLPPYTINPTF